MLTGAGIVLTDAANHTSLAIINIPRTPINLLLRQVLLLVVACFSAARNEKATWYFFNDH